MLIPTLFWSTMDCSICPEIDTPTSSVQLLLLVVVFNPKCPDKHLLLVIAQTRLKACLSIATHLSHPKCMYVNRMINSPASATHIKFDIWDPLLMMHLEVQLASTSHRLAFCRLPHQFVESSYYALITGIT